MTLRELWQHMPSISRIPATTAARMTIWAHGFFAITGGIAVWSGGYQRWSLATYSTLREIPGGPYTLGPILLAAGILVFTGSFTKQWWIKFAGLLTQSVWCCLIAGAVANSAFMNPMVGTLGPPTFLTLAFTSAILIVIDEKHQR